MAPHEGNHIMRAPLFTSTDWIDGDDYSYAYAETSDPRVIAVIKNDDDATFERCLDGDAILPTFMIDGERVQHVGGYSGNTEDIAQRIVEARDRFRYAAGYRYNGLSHHHIAKSEEMTARWARIFHETVFNRGQYGYQSAYDIIVLSTPEFREHVGNPAGGPSLDAEQAQCDAAATEIANIADGYVYGIGYAVNEERTSHAEPVEYFEFTEEIQSWGYVGTEYAKSEAAAFRDGTPDLPEMLDIVIEVMKASA